MADYWKSNERKHCNFCNCWISDNKASISFHENGKRHKMNVAKRITDISRSSEKAEKERQKMDADIRKMEDAAMRSYAMDIHGRGDLTARSIGTMMAASAAASAAAAASATTSSGTMSSSGVASVARPRQQDPMRLAGNSDDENEGFRVSVRKVESAEVPNASLWVEGKTDEGYTYYWNVKTNESVWEEPKEGYLSWTEYQRINEIALKQQELQQATEAKHFRENVNEEVARYNREKLKMFRPTETVEEKQAKRERKNAFKTEEEATTQEIGSWEVVDTRQAPEAPAVDLELPKVDNYYYAPPVTISEPVQPPVKRFKEKTISALDVEDTDATATSTSTSTTFKKRKFAAKGNARKRLDDD